VEQLAIVYKRHQQYVVAEHIPGGHTGNQYAGGREQVRAPRRPTRRARPQADAHSACALIPCARVPGHPAVRRAPSLALRRRAPTTTTTLLALSSLYTMRRKTHATAA
jgi:transposase